MLSTSDGNIMFYHTLCLSNLQWIVAMASKISNRTKLYHWAQTNVIVMSTGYKIHAQFLWVLLPSAISSVQSLSP